MARLLAEGYGQSEAYRMSYNTKGNVNSVNVQAYRARKDPRMVARVEFEHERMKQALAGAGITAKKKAEKYAEILESKNFDGNPDHGTQLKAMDQINKIDQSYAPERSVRMNVKGDDFLKNLNKEAQTE